MDQDYDICWDVKAGKQLKKIYQNIKKKYSEKSALDFRQSIISKIDGLRTQPEKFPPEPLLSHRKENLRYIVVKSGYKVIYEFKNQEIRILYIYNTRRDPKQLTKYFK